MRARVQEADFDVAVELEALHSTDARTGAMVCFVGLVRDFSADDAVHGITLEHYPGMTEKALGSMLDDASRRWPLLDACIVHRVGRLRPGDRIVLVAVAAEHRGEAFDACEFLIDFLKTRAPFWKKEHTAGGDRWVEAKDRDAAAADRWQR